MTLNPRRTQIPYEGGSGRTPTGALQFGNDWPGLFIRGDNTGPIVYAIRTLEEKCANANDGDIKSALRILGEIADIIERDVVVRKEEFDT